MDEITTYGDDFHKIAIEIRAQANNCSKSAAARNMFLDAVGADHIEEVSRDTLEEIVDGRDATIADFCERVGVNPRELDFQVTDGGEEQEETNYSATFTQSELAEEGRPLTEQEWRNVLDAPWMQGTDIPEIHKSRVDTSELWTRKTPLRKILAGRLKAETVSDSNPLLPRKIQERVVLETLSWTLQDRDPSDPKARKYLFDEYLDPVISPSYGIYPAPHPERDVVFVGRERFEEAVHGTLSSLTLEGMSLGSHEDLKDARKNIQEMQCLRMMLVEYRRDISVDAVNAGLMENEAVDKENYDPVESVREALDTRIDGILRQLWDNWQGVPGSKRQQVFEDLRDSNELKARFVIPEVDAPDGTTVREQRTATPGGEKDKAKNLLLSSMA